MTAPQWAFTRRELAERRASVKTLRDYMMGDRAAALRHRVCMVHREVRHLLGDGQALAFVGLQRGQRARIPRRTLGRRARTRQFARQHLHPIQAEVVAMRRHRVHAHRGIDELVVVADMSERKRVMIDRADAFLTLPGGVGTMEEMFEVLCWSYLGLHPKPTGLLAVGTTRLSRSDQPIG